MDGPVALHEGGRLGEGELAKGLVEGVGGQVGVEPLEGGAQAAGEHHRVVAVALGAGFSRSDVRAVENLVAEALEPGEGRLLDDGLGEGAHLTAASRASRRVWKLFERQRAGEMRDPRVRATSTLGRPFL